MEKILRITVRVVIGLMIFMLAIGMLFPFMVVQSIFSLDQELIGISVSKQQAMDAFNYLNESLIDGRFKYFEYIKDIDIQYGDTRHYGSKIDANDNKLALGESLAFAFNIEQAGLYHIALKYEMEEAALNNATIAVHINDEIPFYEASTIELPLRWYDETKDFEFDRYGDQTIPQKNTVKGTTRTYLYNNTYITVEPLLFFFETGYNQVTITNISSQIFKVESLEAIQPGKIKYYTEYIEQFEYAGAATPSRKSIVVDAIDYIVINSPFIRMFSHNSPTVSPHSSRNRLLNVIASDSWDEPGKEIVYEIDVPVSGLYNIALHHQAPKEDFSSFRSIRINDEIPFKEMKSFPLRNTIGNSFTYEILSNAEGLPFYFYLEKGINTISLRSDIEPLADEIRKLQLMIDHINQFALDILKITGQEPDRNRTWWLTRYLPETYYNLRAYKTLIRYVIQQSSVFAPNGYDSASLSYLRRALQKIEHLLEDPDKLPIYFTDLYGGPASVNLMISITLDLFMDQPVTLNEIKVFSGEFALQDNASWYTRLRSEAEGFLATFVSDRYVVELDEKVLNVWINRPITHVDTLQKMVDQKFTPETGIEVKLSIMPDVNRLLLAAAADITPDVAMGLPSFMPFDLAIRNAAYDLTRFEDFWDYSRRFTPGAFVPYVLNDGVYALPETLQFFATIYRTDIFKALDLEVPDTWQDVTNLLPQLQRYGMNFFHPIAGGGAIKWFFQTSGFIYQKGGLLYSDDGLRAAINSEESVKGIDFLNDLFVMYSLPVQVPSFYNAFRQGTLPVGIVDFGTYMQIKNAAPELAGKWDLANYPAMINEDGEINRWFIANGSGSVILADTMKPEQSWEFLKWWMSEEVQTEYAFKLMSIFGPEYLWLSGNLEALENSPIDIADRRVIADQIKWLRDVPRTPGQYMLERGLSNIWNRVVFDGVPTRIAIDQQVTVINREIRRKMIEFGFLDEFGNVLKVYRIRDIDWIKEQMRLAGGETDD